MALFSTIMVALDLGHEASWRKALPTAVEMVREGGGALHVATVVPDFGAAIVQGYFPQDYEREALLRAKASLDALVAAEVPSDIPVTTHLEHGAIRTHILARAERIGADLIVMASHPPDQMREFLVGSHASWMVRNSPISVLVLRGSV